MFLGRGIGKRLEPVRVVRGPLGESPHLHGLRHFIRNAHIKLAPHLDGLHHLLEGTLGEVLLHGLDTKGIASVQSLKGFHGVLCAFFSHCGTLVVSFARVSLYSATR